MKKTRPAFLVMMILVAALLVVAMVNIAPDVEEWLFPPLKDVSFVNFMRSGSQFCWDMNYVKLRPLPLVENSFELEYADPEPNQYVVMQKGIWPRNSLVVTRMGMVSVVDSLPERRT